MNALAPAGRALYALLFIISSFGHFSSRTIGYAAQQGVPAPAILVPLSGVLALVGGLSVLLGLRARAGAWLLVAFLVPVTLFMHNFWAIGDPAIRQMQWINFLKNLALLGGALLVAYFGPGPVSVDDWVARRYPERPGALRPAT